MKIFELDIPKLRYSEFLEEIKSFLNSSQERWKSIFTPNPEICLATLRDKEFLEVLQEANYLTSDGIGLYLGYQISESGYGKLINILLSPYYLFNIIFRKKCLYEKYGDRICGSDLTRDLVKYSEKNSIRIAVLDPYFPDDVAKCKSQESFTKIMNEKFPGLGLDFYILREEEKEDIFGKIKNSDAKILFSTLGMKKQEISVMEFLEKCPSLKLGLGIWSSFDYFTGFQKRAPKIWRDVGLEWLYRIFTSPGKLKRLRRIYQAVIVFPVKVLFDKTEKKN